jgi:hypothetical protein
VLGAIAILAHAARIVTLFCADPVLPIDIGEENETALSIYWGMNMTVPWTIVKRFTWLIFRY